MCWAASCTVFYGCDAVCNPPGLSGVAYCEVSVGHLVVESVAAVCVSEDTIMVSGLPDDGSRVFFEQGPPTVRRTLHLERAS